MADCVRYWTEGERNALFQDYFDSLVGTCPACAQSVSYRMNHTREVVTLSVRCENCGNLAILFFGGIIGLPAEKVSHDL